MLHNLFNTPEALNELPALISHVQQYKNSLDSLIYTDIQTYNHTRSQLKELTNSSVSNVSTLKARAAQTSDSIAAITSSIQHLDQCKKNLVLSMNILKRLQMLTEAYNTLSENAPQKDYKKLGESLGATRELLVYFRPYKSVEQINQLHLLVQTVQQRVVDDILMDFDDFVARRQVDAHVTQNLIHGCAILADTGRKQQLLDWFYAEMLRDVQSIFHSAGEAGSLDNIGRRYIYFENNTLKAVSSRYKAVFPDDWHVERELVLLFCKATAQDVRELLQKNTDGSHTLEQLQVTLEFEKRMNEKFKTSDFSQSISSVFEPYLQVWVAEQSRVLSRKMAELQGTQLAAEFQEAQNGDDLFATIRVNNVPNIAASCTELFRAFHKMLTQILRLSNGDILVDLSRLFVRFLIEYHDQILAPMLPQSDRDLGTGIEPIKYLTMLLNTGDYIVNNTDDLADKFTSVVRPTLRGRLPSYEPAKDVYFSLINRAISSLLLKISNDLVLPWRRFANNNWDLPDKRPQVSAYMVDVENTVVFDNLRYILPMIIRDSYVRSFCDRLVEMLVAGFADNLRSVPITSLDTLDGDLRHLEDAALEFPKHADPTNPSYTVSKLYQKYVKAQFETLRGLVAVLKAPIASPEDFVGTYFESIKDRSVPNLQKVLSMRDVRDMRPYIEVFRSQIAVAGDLQESNSLLANLAEIKETPKSPKSPNLLPKINLEKNLRELALNGENHVNKLNENFRSFGRLFGRHSEE